VTHLGSGCQRPAELLPAQLPRARDWSGMGGLQGRQERRWGSPFSQLVPAVGRAWPCLEGGTGVALLPLLLCCSPRDRRPRAGWCGLSSSAVSHCSSRLLVAGCQEALSPMQHHHISRRPSAHLLMKDPAGGRDPATQLNSSHQGGEERQQQKKKTF